MDQHACDEKYNFETLQVKEGGREGGRERREGK